MRTNRIISIFAAFGLCVLSCGGTSGDNGTPFNPGGGGSFVPGASGDEGGGGGTPSDPSDGPLTITWSDEQTIGSGGYGRAHRLNDGRLLMMFSRGGGVMSCYSSDNGYNWTTPAQQFQKLTITENGQTAYANIVNPEFAQLPPDHPTHPNRIIFSTNLRPVDSKTSVFPYSIGVSVSDDLGKTWTPISSVYQSDKWPGDVGKGCWEPFVLVLPDGTVQVYFSDETPYYRNNKTFQNISVVESKDGGKTFGAARICAYTAGYRDGMPVLMLYDNNIYLAIEHNASGQKLHPQIVRSTVSDNWSKTRPGDSSDRFDPFLTDIQAATIYTGAPYLIHTDNYFVLSYQSSKGSSVASHDHSVMEVVACPVSEYRDGKFITMRGTTRPFTVDQVNDSGLWNSMCDLGGDSFLAVSQIKNHIVIARGRITGTK